MRGKRQLPEHIPGTMRAWRIRKRKELRALLKAADKVLLGCAYAPQADGCYYMEIFQNLRQFKQAWSQKEWGK